MRSDECNAHAPPEPDARGADSSFCEHEQRRGKTGLQRLLSERTSQPCSESRFLATCAAGAEAAGAAAG